MPEFFLPSDIEEIAAQLGDVASELSGKSVLLTGGGGFLGRYFTEVFKYLNEHVLEQPARVIALDNLLVSEDKKFECAEDRNVTAIEHDVNKPFEWDGDLDYVFHAASVASPFYYRAYPLETLEVAVTGTRHMLELADRKDARLVYFSSSEIYGDPDARHVPTQESYRGNVACQGPRACYDESKRLGETLCWIFHNNFGTSTNVIRPFNIYGPGMKETDYRVLPNFASRIKGGQPLNVYGSGSQTRTFCYITDAIVGFLRVATRGVPGEAYNIGNPHPEISMSELVARIETILGRELPANIVEYPDSYPADEPQRRCPDIRKAHLQIGYRPKVKLEEGLRRFLAWSDSTYQGEQ